MQNSLSLPLLLLLTALASSSCDLQRADAALIALSCGASVALALSAAAVIRAFRLLTVQLSLNANKAATLAVSAAVFGDVSLLRSDCAALVACFAAATGLALAPEPGDSFQDPAFFRAVRKCVRPAGHSGWANALLPACWTRKTKKGEIFEC